MVGQILINFLFASAIVSSGAYFLSLRGDDERLRTLGRSFFLIVFGGLLVASAMLMYNVMTHDFRYTYVASYSSRELPWYLLMATFYAGQEGSFMLWTLMTAGIGMGMIPYVRRHKYESAVMGFYSLILVFLLLMLVAKSPFALVWETYADQGIAEGFMPINGRGLNPLLQNVWITIHPPILFMGFASMAVPFAFAMGALVRRDYHHWVKVALPWTLFAAAVLGFGIMLGGFWAYETLGWGGFWGWDPVENSSLVPWLVCVALVHTMLTQRKTNGLVRTNIALAVTAFILILYSTFLTRSGVLGDTSVHSFVDPGMFAYVLLIVFMATFILLGYGMILYRSRDISSGSIGFRPMSREFALSIGSAVVMASAVFVLLGTSWPLIHDILGMEKIGATDPEFYNSTHLYIAIAVALINAVSLIMSWRSTGGNQFLRRLLPSLGLAVVATAASYAFGIRDIVFTALAFGAFLALFVNLELAARIIVKKPLMIGAYISHFGLAFLFLGIITTSRYSVTDHLRLVENEPVKALGRTFTYLGYEQVDKQYQDREKYEYLVKVEENGGGMIVRPVLYWSDFNKRQSAFLEPGIDWGLVSDVYVTPQATETLGEAPSITVQKAQTTPLPIDSSYTITLERFDMAAMMQNTDPNNMRIGVVVTIGHNGQTSEHTIFTTFTGNMASRVPEPLAIPNTSYSVMFDRLIPNRENLGQSQVVLSFVDTNDPATQPKSVFVVEVSVKPLIGLVWVGVILIVSGFFWAIVRRAGEIGDVLRSPAAPRNEDVVKKSAEQVEAE